MKPDCIRKVSNFGAVKKHHLIDSGSFNKDLFNLEVPIASPKLVALMDQIALLDKTDMEEHGKHYKHMIFCDVNSPAYGYKIIASAMVARDYTSCFEPKGTGFHLKEDEDLLRTEGNNFAVLASKPMYGRIFHVAFKKKLLAKYNERDANINGALVRIIILDQGFKEGIDLFDMKYVHLFEPLLPSDEKQAIGRSTRFCGQSGLHFIPTLGWPLHVYQYDNDLSILPNTGNFKTSEEMWIDALNLDMTQITFANNLNAATIDAAVDKELTDAIHTFSVNDQSGGAIKMKRKFNIRMQKSKAKDKAKDKGIPLKKQNTKAKAKAKTSTNHLAFPPSKKLGLVAMHEYINEHFGEFRYPKGKLENKCIASADAADSDFDVSRIITFTQTQDFARHYFTPASPYKGIMLYHSPGTGKLCSGIAVASSSFDKEDYSLVWVTRHTLKADFWKNMIGQICNIATREKVMSGEIDMPALNASKKSVMGPNWIEPISYKQFTNLLKRDNKYYDIMVERNGEEDPLRKTLLIIDECHKLYTSNAAKSESPDMDEFTKWIQNSYAVSGKDSVRVILMSGTPYTDDAMELIKLFNLLREEDDQLPVDFSEFAEEYLDGEGKFTTKGLASYQDAISGYVSYLNRSQDARSFAYPIFHNVNVSIPIFVKDVKNQYDLEMKQLKENIRDAKVKARNHVADLKNETKVKVAEAKEALAKFKVHIAAAKEKKREETKKCMDKTVKERPACKQNAIEELDRIMTEIEVRMSQLTNVANLKQHYADQINGAKAVATDSADFAELTRIKELMDGFKNELKVLRSTIVTKTNELRSMRVSFKKLKTLYTSKMAAVKGQLNEKEAKKTIRETLGHDVKVAKKELDDFKANVYNMRQGLFIIRLKMKRAVLADYSPFTMLNKKCGSDFAMPAEKKESKHSKDKKDKNKSKSSKSNKSSSDSHDSNASASSDTDVNTVDVLKQYYVDTLETKINSGKPVTKSFILLNYHPDKIPIEIKELIARDLKNNDKQSNIYASRVFSALKVYKTISLADLKYVMTDSMVGGKGKRKLMMK